MIEFICFLSFKMFIFVLFTVMWLFIPFVAFCLAAGVLENAEKAFDNNWCDSGHLKKIYYKVAIAFFMVLIFAYIPYCSWIWPTNKSTFGPSNYIYFNLIESFSEYKLDKQKNQPPVRTNLPREIVRFELVSWNPPKHFYVTLKDVKTNQIWERTYVSKHCNNAHNLKAGEEYNLSVTYYTLSNRPGERFMEFNNLYSAFCE